MERHVVDEQQAFQLLREHARRTNRKIVDVAESVIATHRLLPSGREPVPVDEGFATSSGDDRGDAER